MCCHCKSISHLTQTIHLKKQNHVHNFKALFYFVFSHGENSKIILKGKHRETTIGKYYDVGK